MRVLIVDDEKHERDGLGEIVTSWGHEVRTASDGVQALNTLTTFAAAVIITDLKMPRMDGFELLRELRSQERLPPTIVLTGFGSLDLAVSLIHDLGGFWFLEKPVNLNALKVLVDRAGAHSRLAHENERLRRELVYRGVLCDLVGVSASMQEIFSLIQQVAPTDAAVLITGESGTGKELVARAIHSLSSRREGPLVPVNCAALPETLIEAELFGHEKGAFTGALDRRMGCIEMAQGGTLFLDEIAEMQVQMQAKLLRVLESFRFRRIGGKQEIEANIRLIAATNRVPKQAIEEGKLREDLYYRINVFHIHLPPLRNRREDIPSLVEAMIHQMNARHGTRVSAADAEVLHLLAAQHWQGNVRELRNVMERAVILAGEGEIMPAHLPLGYRGLEASPVKPSEVLNGLGISVNMTVREAEKMLIEGTLKQTANNKVRAAKILGISAKTLHSKLKQHKLQREQMVEQA